MNKESLMAMGLISALCSGPYSQPLALPKGTNQSRQARKNRTYGAVGCAVCGKTHITLVKRDGLRYCRECDARMERGVDSETA